MQLEALLAGRADVWRGDQLPARLPAGPSTGFAALDDALPWGGWPPASLSEVLSGQPGAGLALLLPVLVALSARPRWLLLVDPPQLPYAPALAARGLDLARLVLVYPGNEAPWTMEQALRSGACGLVLGWERTPARSARGQSQPALPRPVARHRSGGTPADWSMPRLRRLQLAAMEGDSIAVLLRPSAAAAQSSPAALRLMVHTTAAGLDCQLLKLRGGRAGARVMVGAAG